MQTTKRALFIVFKKYKGILEGGGMANRRNLVMAQHILGTKNVDVVYLHDESKRRPLWDVVLSALFFPFGYYNGMLPWRVKSFVRKAADYNYVFLSTSLFGIVAKALKEHNYKGTVIAHFHNIESLYYESSISRNMPFRNIIIRCAALNDGFCCKYADTVLALNRRDSDTLKKIYGRGADLLVPIAVPDKLPSGTTDKSQLTGSVPTCLFLGSYFAPNVEGISWFVKNVLPHVNIKLLIVGKGMAKLKEHTLFNDIEVIGDAPDIAPYYSSADFIILPIFSGSGMKVKTCESLMYGKNILGTDEAFEGYSFQTDKVGGLCNNAAEFIERINHFASQPTTRFNRYSRSVYEQNYSEASSVELFRKVFDLAQP